MMVLSYLIGQKYFPINYNIGKFMGYLGLSVLLYAISTIFKPEMRILSMAFHSVLLLIFLAVVLFVEKPKLSFR
jgi:hypothetical protein